MKTTLFSISIVMLMACGGGGNKVVNATSPGGEGDDPATPFGDGAVKAKLRSMPGSAECGLSPSTTLGDAFQAQKNQLKSAGMVTEESFRCTARPDNRWDCQWSVSGKPSEETESVEPAAPAEGAEMEAPPAPPTPFTITATVGSDGSVNAKDVHCIAAS